MNDLKIKPNPMMVRTKILTMQAAIESIPGAMRGDCFPLKHTFVDGAYVREIFMPKGMLIVSKLHKITHPYFVMKGDVSVFTEEGIVRIKAPYYGVTKAGTKRVLYIHEDTLWVTVHITQETDLVKIEEEIISKSYAEFDQEHMDKLFKEAFKITEETK